MVGYGDTLEVPSPRPVHRDAHPGTSRALDRHWSSGGDRENVVLGWSYVDFRDLDLRNSRLHVPCTSARQSYKSCVNIVKIYLGVHIMSNLFDRVSKHVKHFLDGDRLIIHICG